MPGKFLKPSWTNEGRREWADCFFDEKIIILPKINIQKI